MMLLIMMMMVFVGSRYGCYQTGARRHGRPQTGGVLNDRLLQPQQRRHDVRTPQTR